MNRGQGDPKRGDPRREDQKAQPLAPHVPPDERGRLAFSNAVAKVQGYDEAKKDISYYAPELIHCTLPHSPIKERDWIRKSGSYSLIVSSGIDEEGVPFGIPSGAFPRLVMSHLFTRVVATRDRRVELNSRFTSYLKEVGYVGNYRGNSRAANSIRDSLLRLLNARISFQYLDERRRSRMNIDIAQRFDLWFDYKNPDADSLLGSWVQLSDDLYQALLEAPVPLRTDILAALRKSPLGLDVYMWISHRLFRMQAAGEKELTLTYGALQAQFGTGIAEENYRLFRSRFKQALGHVAEHWKLHDGDKDKLLLNYELHEDGLTLYRSPLLIGRGPRQTTQEEAAQIIADRRFDKATRQKAQLRAGTWSVSYLEENYFAWIEREGIAPKNPAAHFLDFIERHRKLHKEKP